MMGEARSERGGNFSILGGRFFGLTFFGLTSIFLFYLFIIFVTWLCPGLASTSLPIAAHIPADPPTSDLALIY